MKIYIHKVKVNNIDGWGRDAGLQETILGVYKTKELAENAKKLRDQDKLHRYFDVSKSWIEEGNLYE